MTKCNHCPNCRRTPSGGLLGGLSFTVYECRAGRTLACRQCGDTRCPDCGSQSRREAGQCWLR
jgi:hypothetical protein